MRMKMKAKDLTLYEIEQAIRYFELKPRGGLTPEQIDADKTRLAALKALHEARMYEIAHVAAR